MRRGRLSKPGYSKGLNQEPNQAQGETGQVPERSSTLLSMRETLHCEGVSVKVWRRANEEQTERRKGRRRGKGGGRRRWDCS